MRRIVFPILTLAVLVTGCGINQRGLARDVRHLLDKCNVHPESIKATMGTRTRTGIAEFPATAADVAALVTGFELQESDPTEIDTDFISWRSEGASLYDHLMLRPQDGLRIYRSARRSKTLQLPNGSAFEYLLLFWDEAKGLVLMQMSYAYG